MKGILANSNPSSFFPDGIVASKPVFAVFRVILITRWIQADKDLLVLKNVRGSSLDPSSNQKTLKTAKTGFDATIPSGKKLEGFELAKIPFMNKINVANL